MHTAVVIAQPPFLLINSIDSNRLSFILVSRNSTTDKGVRDGLRDE